MQVQPQPLGETGDQMPVRETVATLPDMPLMPPFEMRREMTWIDFSTIANPLGTPPSIIEAIIRALASGQAESEPDRDGYTIKTALSSYYGLPTAAFLIGSTPNDLIRAVAQTYQPCNVGIFTPSETGFALAIGNAGHSIVEISSHTGFLAPDPSISKAHGVSFDAALLANPSYPTSRLLPRTTLLRYLESCSWVIVDERSIELTLGGESFAELTSQYRNLIVVRSLSESFALSGIPVSYCIAHPKTIEQINGFYDPSGISMFAEVVGAVVQSETQHLEKAREFLETEIPWLQCMLSLIPGIDIFPAEGNYVMCTFTAHEGMSFGVKNTDELALKLQRSGFLIRKLNDIPGLEPGRHFCVSVRQRSDNERLVDAMRKIIVSE